MKVYQHGSYVRKSDSRTVFRYRCIRCKKTFSTATSLACFGQKKRRLNHMIWKHLCSGNTQRRTAQFLGVNRKTVVRKFRFLANFFRERRLKALYENNILAVKEVLFDEMESSIHSKCLPVTIPLAVEKKKRKILDFQVEMIPPKGKLAEISLKKYGHRPNHSRLGLEKLFTNLRLMVVADAAFKSDQKTSYPGYVKKYFPQAKEHVSVKGVRGCVTGQGEMKKTAYDPLFDLNQTAAMIRYNVSRLARRSWCTSKTIQGLKDHLEIYLAFHNQKLI